MSVGPPAVSASLLKRLGVPSFWKQHPEIRGALDELRSQAPINTVITLGGQNEELERSYDSLFFALGLAIFLVYLVMASQFASMVHPFVILFAVPFAIVGVLLSLWVT